MSIMTIIALSLSFVALAMGTASILGSRGQRIDQRKHRRRHDRDRIGGRREGDASPLLA